MASRLKQIPESLLTRLWKERASRKESLKAENGRRFRVIYPGRASTTAGPDFRDAVLEEEEVGLVRGDVEVHVRQKDWDAHGHRNDPRYNGVVLHVVARPDEPYSTLHSGTRVPVLSLEPLLDDRMPSPGEGRDLWPLLKAHGYVPPKDATEMGILLDRAGDSRFLEKSAAFLAFVREEDPEQVLYAVLMEALGYSQNCEPFLELAYRVPYCRLKKVGLESPPEERLGRIRELLLSEAGFLTSLPDAKAMSPARWHLFRVRPQNHPRRRIMGFACLLDLFLPSMEGRPSGDLVSVRPWAGKGLVEGMTCLVQTSWSSARNRGRWYALENELSGICGPCPGGDTRDDRQENRAAIGKGRLRDMVVNCVLPFLHALAEGRGDTQLAQLSLGFYQGFPRLQENELTREMRQQLFSYLLPAADEVNRGWGRVVCNARRQQGLLHLHRLIISPRIYSAKG